MPFIAYISKRFHSQNTRYIELANAIIAEYQADGLALTLRQLYYQFVSRDIFANKFANYRVLQGLVNDARLAGLMDWDAIEDRTRNLSSYPTDESPEDAIDYAARYYREPKWDTQPEHVEVWVEKDALLGVIERACQKYETPFFSCRGYASQSEVWASARRLRRLGKPAYILHLGDHDPSGVDMSRDIQERMELFEAGNVTVERLALNMDQIKRLNPPPNPAKMTDSRVKDYIAKFGTKSWELDALDPHFIVSLIHEATERHLDPKAWKKAVTAQEKNRKQLASISENFTDVVEWLESNGKA